MDQPKPSETVRGVFPNAADLAVGKVRSTYNQREGEYNDTWALKNRGAVFMKSVLRDCFGIVDPDPQAVRLLQCAALIDIKDSRMLGPWKEDTVIDGIAYRLVFTTLREEYDKHRKGPEPVPDSRGSQPF